MIGGNGSLSAEQSMWRIATITRVIGLLNENGPCRRVRGDATRAVRIAVLHDTAPVHLHLAIEYIVEPLRRTCRRFAACLELDRVLGEGRTHRWRRMHDCCRAAHARQCRTNERIGR